MTLLSETLQQFVKRVRPSSTTIARENGGLRYVLYWLEQDTFHHTDFFVETLKNVKDIELVCFSQTQSPSENSRLREFGMRSVVQKIIHKFDADVVVACRLKKSENVLYLWFISRENNDIEKRSFDQPYIFLKGILENNSREALHTQITSAALAAAMPFVDSEERGRILTSDLASIVDDLKHLLESDSEKNLNRRINLRNTLGSVLTALGEREGKTEYLEQAISSFRTALDENIREQSAFDRAFTQNGLGNALFALGQRNDDTVLFEQAIESYCDALQVFNSELAPLDWATANKNLGSVLQTLGERKNSARILEQALNTYRLAVQDLDWSIFKNASKTHSSTSTEPSKDNMVFKQMIDLHSTVLEKLSRDFTPFGWVSMDDHRAGATGKADEYDIGNGLIASNDGHDDVVPNSSTCELTPLLEEVFKKASELEKNEQNAFARFMLAELSDEQRWSGLFNRPESERFLERMATEVLSNYEAGLTKPLRREDL